MILPQHGHPIRHLFVVFVVFVCGAITSRSVKAEDTSLVQTKVTVGSLLDEMTNRDSLARLPSPSYTCRQASSYDRSSVSPNEDGWFANWDRSQFVRSEEVEGRTEHVMMDEAGPGAIVRVWATWHGPGGGPFSNGTLRVYLDGQPKPVFEGPITEFIDGGGEADKALAGPPLGQGVSPKTQYAQRGHNLYLPIPYEKHCKITYSTDVLVDRGARKGEALYYQINYRTYEPNTQVESFSIEKLDLIRDKVNATGKRLLQSGVVGTPLRNRAEAKTRLEPGDHSTCELKFSGSAAVKTFAVQLAADDLAQALRSTIVKMTFDGETTVWCPVGDFFGIGYQLRPVKTWYTDVSEDGHMTCYWVMPFAKSCEISLHNLGDQSVTVEKMQALSAPSIWDERSMHFHATWRQLSEVETGMNGNMDETSGARDVNYVTVTGQGVYVGDTLTVFNGTNAWWGEGDEKIYVDGESFPSHFGTGTEDYYGYAWCRPESFDAPFHAQPEGGGNLAGGYSVNSRYRSLDAIPFNKSIQVDMELWHWRDTKMDYAPTTFWYAVPEAKWNVEADAETAAREVTLKVSQIIKPVIVEGAIEGESLRIVEASGGKTEIQTMAGIKWSQDQQLWWKDGKVNDRLTLEFAAPHAGEFKVVANLVHAPDYAITTVSVNDLDAGQYDLYAAGVTASLTELGTFKLNKGKNQITFEISGANPKAVKRYMVGLDYLKLEPSNR